MTKEGGLYYMGCTYIFFSSKMEQTLHSPSHGSEESPHEEKIVKKNSFDLLFGPFKNGIVCSFYAYKGGLQKITNVEMINFPVGNPCCQYHKEHFQFHQFFSFFSKLNTQRAVAVAS